MPYQQRAESPEMAPQWMYDMDPGQRERFRQHAAGAPLDQRSFMQAFPEDSYASYMAGYEFARGAGAMGEPIALTPPAESQPAGTEQMIREAADWLAQAPLDEMGRRKANELQVKLQQIQSNSHNFPRPGQREQLLNTWSREFSNAMLESRLDPPPTVADNWNKNIMVDQRTGRRFQQIMRNGEVQFKAIDDESPNKQVNWIAEMYQGDGAKLLRDIEYVQKQHQESMAYREDYDGTPLSPQEAMDRLSAAAQAAATGRWPESVPQPAPPKPEPQGQQASQPGQKTGQPKGVMEMLPRPSSQEEFDAVKSGEYYIERDGSVRIKP